MAEQITLAAAGLCVVAVLGTAVALGSWTTCLKAPCWLAVCSFLPRKGPAGLGTSSQEAMCSQPPTEEPGGALRSPSWDVSCWANAYDHRDCLSLSSPDSVSCGMPVAPYHLQSYALVHFNADFNCMVLYHLAFLTAAFLPVTCTW